MKPSVCPSLEQANEARRRAWNELQAIRKILDAVVDDLLPPPKPRSFEAEGAILRAALERAFREPHERLAALYKAVEGIKPYISNTLNDGKYPLRMLDLNLAMRLQAPKT
jgi:hypothetical protein